MHIPFMKVEGLQNDYLFINHLIPFIDDPCSVAIKMSKRFTGVGSDGIILVERSQVADFKMSIYNADGSQAKMCGNGIRGLAVYAHVIGLTQKKKLSIETLSGIKQLIILKDNKGQFMVSVQMGHVSYDSTEVGLANHELPLKLEEIEVLGKIFKFSAVSVGNPHLVTQVEDVNRVDIRAVGKELQKHPWFPGGINVEFYQILNPREIKMRVYERGVGETRACGTGATAVSAVAYQQGLIKSEVKVWLPGGQLIIDCQNKADIVMTGPANPVFSGSMNV